MSLLAELGADVDWPDRDLAASSTAALGTGFGRLGDLAGWLAGTAGGPPSLRRARIVVVGERPAAVDAAELAGAGVRQVTDAAAGSSTEVGVAAGVAAADAEVDAGTDLLVVAAPDCDLAALAVISLLTGVEPVKVLPRGAGLPVEQWVALAEGVRDLRNRVATFGADPGALLEAFQCSDLEVTTGMLLRAAARRTPMVLDGLGALAAACVAYAVQPRTSQWCQAADGLGVAGSATALGHLDLRPILDLGVESADGTAGALALVVLRAAAQLVSDRSA